MKTLEVEEKYLSQHVLQPSSIIKIRNIFNYLNEFSPEFPVSSGFINEWVKWLRDTKHLSDITTQRHYTYMRGIAKYMNEQYDIPNPFLKSLRPKYNKTPRVYFSPSKLAQAIRSCQTDIERALILGLIDSACRAQDLAYLKGSQVVISNTQCGFLTSSDKKTGSHFYRLNPQLAQIFKTLAGNDNGYVFKANPYKPSFMDENIPATATAICHRVERILIRAGFKGTKLGAHTFRHSSASLIAKTTKSALAVKGILGHADIETSMEYIHDAETEISQNISPLQLLSDAITPYFKSEVKQSNLLTSVQSSELIPINNKELTTVDTLIQESYPPVPDEFKHIRPLLNRNDIDLLRRAFIALNYTDHALNDESQSRDLYRRILRKSKHQTNLLES